MSKIIFVLALIISFFCFTSPVQAKVIMAESDPVAIGPKEVINDDLFIGAEAVTIDGTVNGDVYVGTGSFILNGTIKGDLVLGTGNAVIKGTVTDDVYMGTGNATLEGAKIGGGLTVGAGTLTLDDNSSVGGSLIAGVGTLRSTALIGRSAMVGAGSLYLDSQVGKELRFGGRKLELGPRTKIAGDLWYALGEEQGIFTQDPAATIGGTVSRYTLPKSAQRDLARADFSQFGRLAGRGFMFISFLSSLLVGLLLLKIWPKSTQAIATVLSKEVLASLGVGFLIIVAIAPLLIALSLSIIGLPLAGLILAIFLIDLYLAKLVSVMVIGQTLAKNFNFTKWSRYAVFALGLFVFYLFRLIPVVGMLASLILTWMGLGAIFKYCLSTVQRK